MAEQTNYIVKNVLNDIDLFVEGKVSENQSVHLQPYGTLINPWPFTSRKLKARVANKVISIPVRLIRRTFYGYFAQQDRALIMTQQRLGVIEDKLDEIAELLREQRAYESQGESAESASIPRRANHKK